MNPSISYFFVDQYYLQAKEKVRPARCSFFFLVLVQINDGTVSLCGCSANQVASNDFGTDAYLIEISKIITKKVAIMCSKIIASISDARMNKM